MKASGRDDNQQVRSFARLLRGDDQVGLAKAIVSLRGRCQLVSRRLAAECNSQQQPESQQCE